jgi:RHS repeat-associated protein
MTDANQNVVWDGGGSDPFMMSPLPTTAMGLRFPGQYYDSETGLHYNYFRDYDPGIGRYTESDLIGLEGGVNTYAYTNDNPTLFADPFGLQSIPDPNGVVPGGPWTPAPGQRPEAFYGPQQPQGGANNANGFHPMAKAVRKGRKVTGRPSSRILHGKDLTRAVILLAPNRRTPATGLKLLRRRIRATGLKLLRQPTRSRHSCALKLVYRHSWESCSIRHLRTRILLAETHTE